MLIKATRVLFILLWAFQTATAQDDIQWTASGKAYITVDEGNIVETDAKTEARRILVKKEQLLSPVTGKPLNLQSYSFYKDNMKVLLFVNAARVWRYKTRGDYWVLDLASNKLTQLGKNLPAQSLMFAKFSPDGKNCAYVSEHNIYKEELASGKITKLTRDGSRKLINGTFDWVYEEEFGCRDGFRWSPDGTKIAYWQVDATKIRDYYMLNTTDSNYSIVIPVEYPKVGEAPSPVRIGVVDVNNAYTRWMDIEGDPQQHYLTRMEWSNFNELVVQQLDRKQQESKLKYCNVTDGSSRTFWAENNEAWVDLNATSFYGEPGGFNWINKGTDFLWISEKDGWRHIYKISRDGRTQTLLTKGDYDIGTMTSIDEDNGYVYFTASPANATQQYLYRIKMEKGSLLDKVKNIGGKSKEEPELVSDAQQKGTHEYNISPNGRFAQHNFSNHNTPPVSEWITLPDHKPVRASQSIAAQVRKDNNIDVQYVQIDIGNNIFLDAWINKPKNFNPAKKYPVVLYVYGEPGASTVQDTYGNHRNFLYDGDMPGDGYVQVAIDNRGTPMLKGAAWRKSIYRKVGVLNIDDMAKGFKSLLDNNPYFDRERTAVWGWSGGGSSTLHLMFRYPELFKTGIAIAAVANQLFYDNIYQERYMGLPQENRQEFINGSPVTYAKNLKGNLLYIHGTGDDNVHFSNAEVLVNELVKYNKQFQYMAYPNRTHNISEGPGTTQHLRTLYTTFLKQHCAPGAR